MSGAFEWIGQLISWFAAFVPRWIVVDATMSGVKFVHGARIVPFGPGITWYWPVTTTVQMYPIARQADDLRSQSIVTKDNKTIAVGGLIVYEVNDIAALVGQTFKPEQTINDIALTSIHDVVCQLEWAELVEQQRSGKLDRSLRSTTQDYLRPYGVRVLKTMLTDMAPCRVLKVMQSTSRDEG